jgi:hypothetical protein
MKLYLDDDSSEALLVALLKQAAHDVMLPVDVGLQGDRDAVHLTHAIRESRAIVSRNYRDFEVLHELVVHAGRAASRHIDRPQRQRCFT